MSSSNPAWDLVGRSESWFLTCLGLRIIESLKSEKSLKDNLVHLVLYAWGCACSIHAKKAPHMSGVLHVFVQAGDPVTHRRSCTHMACRAVVDVSGAHVHAGDLCMCVLGP